MPRLYRGPVRLAFFRNKYTYMMRTGRGEQLTESANIPQAVVDCSQAATVLRMADLGEQHRRSKLSEAVAKTEHYTSTHEGFFRKDDVSQSSRPWYIAPEGVPTSRKLTGKVLTASLKDGTDNHDDTAHDNGDLAAKVVGEERPVDTSSKVSS